jgi:hypothetical protein
MIVDGKFLVAIGLMIEFFLLSVVAIEIFLSLNL